MCGTNFGIIFRWKNEFTTLAYLGNALFWTKLSRAHDILIRMHEIIYVMQTTWFLSKHLSIPELRLKMDAIYRYFFACPSFDVGLVCIHVYTVYQFEIPV